MDYLLAGGIGLSAFDIGFLVGAWWGGFWRRSDEPVKVDDQANDHGND